MQVRAKGDALSTCIKHYAAVETISQIAGQGAQAFEIVSSWRCGGLDFNPHDTAGAVFDDQVNFAADLGAEVK